MNVPATVPPPATTHRKPFAKTLMHVVRRTHLYLGLFLLPWAVLYGVTAFLFNHPFAFADQPVTVFDRSTLVGTPMHDVPSPATTAAEVVAALQTRASADVTYTLVEPQLARYTREFAFATVKAGEQTVNVLVDVTGNGGTVRGRTEPPTKPTPPPAPFAIGGTPQRPARGNGPPAGRRPANADGTLKLEQPLHERVAAAVPTIVQATGHPTGEVTVTSVPDLTFLMRAADTTWRVTYNAQTGTVAGKPADQDTGTEISVRRFLTRLHLAHGYPASVNARWWWAVIVDVMAGVMIFWGISGVFMWWQLKATRWLGILMLVLSAVVAGLLAVGMYGVLTQ